MQQVALSLNHLAYHLFVFICIKSAYTKYLTKGYTSLHLPVAKCRNHLSNEDLEILLLAALKLPTKNLYEHEQEIKPVEGKL